MNLTVLLIAAYLPLIPILFLILRSGSFGRGSVGTLFRLFFMGVAAAVPAFLMEAGVLLLVTVVLRVLPEDAAGGKYLLLSCILRYVLAAALIEEGWKHFVLRASTWKQMTMETVGDGTAAAAVVGAGFSAVLFAAWQAAWRVVPADMAALRGAMPDFLRAGAVVSFLFALLYVPSHFGFSGFMGSIYGVAKGSEQKNHGARAGFMLFVSLLMPVLVHGICAALVGYGIAAEKLLWVVLGFIAEALLAMAMAASLAGARDGGPSGDETEAPVDFADSEEFAEFAEGYGGESAAALEGGTDENAAALKGENPGNAAALEGESLGNALGLEGESPENAASPEGESGVSAADPAEGGAPAKENGEGAAGGYAAAGPEPGGDSVEAGADAHGGMESGPAGEGGANAVSLEFGDPDQGGPDAAGPDLENAEQDGPDPGSSGLEDIVVL